MNQVLRSSCRVASLTLLTFGSSAFAQSKADNGVFGSYKRQAEALGPVVVFPKGGLPVDPLLIEVTHPASGIGLVNDKMLTDEQVTSRISSTLINGATGAPAYDSLVMHVGGCFGGGFIDDMDDAKIPKLSMNTAAAWDQLQLGTEQNNHPTGAAKTARGYFTREWIDDLNADATGKQKTVYSTAIQGNGNADDTKNPYPQSTRDRERPQYFSRSPGSDDIKLGTAADKKLALIFVGNGGRNTAAGRNTDDRRWFNDALAFRQKLIDRGYAAGDIKFMYDDGNRPNGAANPGFAIEAATRDSFNSYFNDVLKPNIAGGDDQVALYLSGHGGLYDNFRGKIRFSAPQIPSPPTIPNPFRATFQFSAGADELASITSPDAGIDSITLSGDPLENVAQGETVSVALANMDETIVAPIGELDYSSTLSSWSLDFSQSTLTSLFTSPGSGGSYEVVFSGTNSQIVLGNFAISVDAAGVSSAVPEPGTVSLAAMTTLGALARRRRRNSR